MLRRPLPVAAPRVQWDFLIRLFPGIYKKQFSCPDDVCHLPYSTTHSDSFFFFQKEVLTAPLCSFISLIPGYPNYQPSVIFSYMYIYIYIPGRKVLHSILTPRTTNGKRIKVPRLHRTPSAGTVSFIKGGSSQMRRIQEASASIFALNQDRNSNTWGGKAAG